jgi:hypothetical protein
MSAKANRTATTLKTAALFTTLGASILLLNSESSSFKHDSMLRKGLGHISSILREGYKSDGHISKAGFRFGPMLAAIDLQFLAPSNPTTNFVFSTPSINFGNEPLGSTNTLTVNVTNLTSSDISFGGSMSYFQSPLDTSGITGPMSPTNMDFQITNSLFIPAGQWAPLTITYIANTVSNVSAIFSLDSGTGPTLSIYGCAISTSQSGPTDQPASSYTVGQNLYQSQSSQVQSFGKSTYSAAISAASSITPLFSTPNLNFSPGSLIFGNVTVGNSSVELTKLLNSSSQSVTISSISVIQTSGSTNLNNYTFSGIAAGSVVAAGGSKILRMTFSPNTYGVINETITLNLSTGKSVSLPIYGSGIGTYSNPLIWNAALDAEVNGYVVGRSDQSGGPYIQISPVIQGTNYVDMTIQPNKAYFYVGRSVVTNSDGTIAAISDFSNEAALPPVSP